MNRNKTLITAHAGAENTPANALEGIRTLCALGADAIEVDVRPLEGRLVLTHDHPVPGGTYTSLEDCLREVVRYEGLKINLDLKQFGLVEEVARLTAACGMSGRVILTGDVGQDELVAADAAGLEAWCNESSLPKGSDLLEGVSARGLEVLNIHYVEGEALLERAAGRLSMWTVGDEAAMVRYLKAGVRNITTRSPLVALRLRAALGTEADACDDFHRHWDAFPGSARLIDREGRILAANAAARQAGFVEGVRCATVPTANGHRDCRMREAFASGTAQGDVCADMMRYWLPVDGRPDLLVHLSFKCTGGKA